MFVKSEMRELVEKSNLKVNDSVHLAFDNYSFKYEGVVEYISNGLNCLVIIIGTRVNNYKIIMSISNHCISTQVLTDCNQTTYKDDYSSCLLQIKTRNNFVPVSFFDLSYSYNCKKTVKIPVVVGDTFYKVLHKYTVLSISSSGIIFAESDESTLVVNPKDSSLMSVIDGISVGIADVDK